MGKKKRLNERLTNLEQSQKDWIGPFRSWIKLALNAKKTSQQTKNLTTKRDFLLNTGSDFVLKDKKVHPDWLKPWAALGAAATSRSFERETGLEPATFSLATRRSTS